MPESLTVRYYPFKYFSLFVYYQDRKSKSGVVAPASNPSTCEAEGGGMPQL